MRALPWLYTRLSSLNCVASSFTIVSYGSAESSSVRAISKAGVLGSQTHMLGIFDPSLGIAQASPRVAVRQTIDGAQDSARRPDSSMARHVWHLDSTSAASADRAAMAADLSVSPKGGVIAFDLEVNALTVAEMKGRHIACAACVGQLISYPPARSEPIHPSPFQLSASRCLPRKRGAKICEDMYRRSPKRRAVCCISRKQGAAGHRGVERGDQPLNHPLRPFWARRLFVRVFPRAFSPSPRIFSAQITDTLLKIGQGRIASRRKSRRLHVADLQ